jgi:acyl-CoA synthetase (AMP-forming)/AMP-acid ligase II
MATATLLNSLSPLAQTPAIIIPTKPCPIILSHKQLCHRILGFRDKLAAVGITRKDAVAIVLPNSLEFAVAFLAIAAQRAVCAPLNPGYRQGEFEFYLDELRATLVLVPRGAIAENGEIVKAARKCNSALAEVYFNGTEVLLELEAPGQANEHKRAELQQSEPGDIALIFHTSGTTGRPKAVGTSTSNC